MQYQNTTHKPRSLQNSTDEHEKRKQNKCIENKLATTMVLVGAFTS